MDIIKKLFNYSTLPNEYWLGPYGVRVPKTIDGIRAEDGGNILYQDGSVTEKGILNPISEKEYKEIYTELKKNGYYYYVGLKPISYISNTITKSFNPQIKNPIVELQYYEAFNKGIHFKPANERYSGKGIVQCDMCKVTGLPECVGYKEIDLCMNCVSKIKDSITHIE